jgi:hypothetical protein
MHQSLNKRYSKKQRKKLLSETKFKAKIESLATLENKNSKKNLFKN